MALTKGKTSDNQPSSPTIKAHHPPPPATSNQQPHNTRITSHATASTSQQPTNKAPRRSHFVVGPSLLQQQPASTRPTVQPAGPTHHDHNDAADKVVADDVRIHDMYQRAGQYRDAGDWDAARRLYSAVLAQRPHHLRALCNRGFVHAKVLWHTMMPSTWSPMHTPIHIHTAGHA